MGCLKLSYYDNERVDLTVVRAGAGVNEKIARPDVTAAALFFQSGQQHTTVLNFLLLFGSSQKVGIVDEGRILHDPQTSSFTYEYHLRDHLGSVRVAFEPTTGGNEVKQINAYYPFGAPIAALSFNPLTSTNRYKHTGMETIEDFDLGYVDNGARWRGSPFAPGFRTRDPLAAKYPHLSPYIYCSNNPINRIDPTGMLDDWFENELTGAVYYNSDMGKDAAGTGDMQGEGWRWMGSNDMFGEVNNNFFANNSEFINGNTRMMVFTTDGSTTGYAMNMGDNSKAFMDKMGYKSVPTQVLEYTKSINQTIIVGPRIGNSFDLGCTYRETEKIGYVPKDYTEQKIPTHIGKTLYSDDCSEYVNRLSLQYSPSPNLSWIGTLWKAIFEGEHDYKSTGPCVPNRKLINEFRKQNESR